MFEINDRIKVNDLSLSFYHDRSGTVELEYPDLDDKELMYLVRLDYNPAYHYYFKESQLTKQEA